MEKQNIITNYTMEKMDNAIIQMMTELRKTFKTGKTLPFSFRMGQLKSLLEMFEKNEAEILTALRKDLRRPKFEAQVYDSMFMKIEICAVIHNLRNWMKPDFLDFNAILPLDSCHTQNEPYGVVLILGTWNYPLNTALSPLVGAIAAGNCAIIKPSEVTPSCAALLSKLIPRYLDSTCYRVIEGGVEETTALLNHKFDYIFLTGSTQVGKIIMTAAAKNLTPITLELGGKSPVYIDDNVNLRISVKRIIWGKFTNGGQTCIAPDYILCSKEVEKEFIHLAKKVIQQYYGSDLQSSSSLARIVNRKHFSRLKVLLDGTKGNIVIGGKCDEDDLWIEPTVVGNVKDTDTLMGEEIFGPILPIVNVESKEAALEFIANRPGNPLAIYVFTNKKSTAKLFKEQSTSGSFVINDVMVQCGVPGLSFGGVGSSGMGNYHGKASFDTFSYKKSVVVRDFSFLTEAISSLRYPPFTDTDFTVKLMTFFGTNWYKFSIPSLRFVNIVMFILGMITMWYFLGY